MSLKRSSQLAPLESIDLELADRLEHDEAFRRRYTLFWAQTEVASELRSMRKRRGKLQADVAELAGTGQSAISRIEKADYDGWTFKTLASIAVALKARLRFKLEPMEDVIEASRRAASQSVLDGVMVADTSKDEHDVASVSDGFSQVSRIESRPFVSRDATVEWTLSGSVSGGIQ